jgi:hypothetical protein
MLPGARVGCRRAHGPCDLVSQEVPSADARRDRPLIVTTCGNRITKSGFDSAWQRMMTKAIANAVSIPSPATTLVTISSVTNKASQRCGAFFVWAARQALHFAAAT